MIKCSICSYQCDNWYVSNWRLACHMNFSLGRCCLELAQTLSCVALAWHEAGGSTPFGVTFVLIACSEASFLFIECMALALLIPYCQGAARKQRFSHQILSVCKVKAVWPILAEGAIALSVTLSGGALFASWKLLQFLSSLIVKVILAIFSWASAQRLHQWGRAGCHAACARNRWALSCMSRNTRQENCGPCRENRFALLGNDARASSLSS